MRTEVEVCGCALISACQATVSILLVILIRACYSKYTPGRPIKEGVVVPSNKVGVSNVLVLSEKNMYMVGKKHGVKNPHTYKIVCILGSSRVCSLS